MQVKKFNILLDKPPVTAEVNGNVYKVNTSFKRVLAYMKLLKSDKDEDLKQAFIFELFFGERIRPADMQGLADWLKWFLLCGEEKEEEKKSRPASFDLLEDSNRVYAAFLQVYGINLRKAKLHWWTFSVLLENLPQGTHLAHVIEIRTKPYEKWMKPKQRNELAELKNRYRIGGGTQDVMGDAFKMLASFCKRK